ncbi:MAG: TrmH family RNA methyltransferase [Clostridiales bacterium]|nr:TrmH family RNA methyltransferase [Clostridiales bacterium]
MPSLEGYKRSLDYSYAPGLFPCMEAVTKRPEWVRRVLVSSSASGEGIEKLLRICEEKRIRVEQADKALVRISGKENCFAAAVFAKNQGILQSGRHVVLHNISDAGNLGTILRTALGFGYKDIAIIRPAADCFDPHTVRASMGAIFSLRIREYDDFESYRADFPLQNLYPFMLQGSVPLDDAVKNKKIPYSIIMGNEGSGLPPSFARIGTPVRIRQSDEIDSLNLSVAAAVGMYEFSKD